MKAIQSWIWQAAIALFLGWLIIDDVFSCRFRIIWVAAYFLLVIALMIWLQFKYAERSRPVEVPVLRPLPRKPEEPAASLASMLLHEFDYVKETASQAMNDRHTMINYFLLSTGVIFAALGVLISKEGGWDLPYRNQILVGLSLLFNAIGWVYFMQIIRLRQAWCESARAMNHIKEFFARHCDFPYPVARQAFRWRPETIPAAAKKFTVFYFSALLIALISASAIFLAALVVLGPIETTQRHRFAIPALMGLAHLFFQMRMYTVLLEEKPPASATKKPSPFPDEEAPTNETRNVELISEKVVFDDFFKLVEGRLRFEKFSGEMSEEVRRLCFERGDAVAVVLYRPPGADAGTKAGSLILIEQFRYPVYRARGRRDGWIYELVAGVIEEGETPEQVVRREVLEETGFEIDRPIPLARIYPSPGGASERIFLYFARITGRRHQGGGSSLEHEDIRILELPVQEVYRMVETGLIQDAKTLLGLLLVREMLSA